jgi:hypothetical protein
MNEIAKGILIADMYKSLAGLVVLIIFVLLITWLNK